MITDIDKLKNNKEVLWSILFIEIGLIFLISLLLMSIPLRSKLFISLIYIIGAYIFLFKTARKFNSNINVWTLMLIISIFFFYGQHILAVLYPSYFKLQDFHILDGRIEDKYIIIATFFIMFCLLLINIGMHLDFKAINYDVKPSVSNIQDKGLKIAGWIFLAISIYPTIKYLMASYSLTNLYGYLGRRTLESSDNYYSILGVSLLQIYISGLFLPSIYALIISYRDKKITKLFYGLLAVYAIMYYLTGSRYEILQIIVSVVLLRDCLDLNKSQKVNYAKIVILSAIVIVFMSMGTFIRSVGVEKFNYSNLAEQMDIGGFLWEPGITFTTVSNILKTCPSKVDFFYGKSYLGAILLCLPEFLRFGFFDKYSLHIAGTFSKYYYHTDAFGYGSSFIAEGYYNLGYFSLLAMVIFGLIIKNLIRIMDSVKISNRKDLLLLLVVVSNNLIFGVRNDLSSIPRIILFNVLPILFVAFVIGYLLDRKELK